MALLRSGTRIYGNATVDTVLVISGEDASTSNTTGALKVAGGIGVTGNVVSSGNIVSLNANLGNAVRGNYFIGNGSFLTGITSTYGNANVASYLPTYTGELSAGDAVFSGNLTVGGTLEYTNVTNLYIKDSIIEQGGDANGAPLTTDDNRDRGSLLHYYDGSAIDAFIGWKNANSEFVVASNVSIVDNNVTINQLGNLRANIFIGDLSGNATNANTAVTVTSNAQPNITSVGTLTSLSVTNDISANTLTGTLTTASQPNITSVGTLSTLTVSGLKTFGNVGTVKITGGDTGYVLSTDGTGNLNWTQQVQNSIVAGTVYTNAQPNITSVGTLNNLSVDGNITLGNGISLGGSFGSVGQLLTSRGDNTSAWASKFYSGNAPPQAQSIDPNYGDCWFYIGDDGEQRLYMWVTDGTSDFFYDFLPPTF